jgi:flavin reductase (DIM6/NTAB) family NADH-FMN oxidoreductase RutF
MTLHTTELTATEMQNVLQHLIAPRPIALASTIDGAGNVNLSPFSFFNLFSCHPPIVIFSPARRVRNNTTKHTLGNIRVVPEVAISVVTYDIVQQASLASGDYPKGTDEFVKAGFTKKPSSLIAPPMVAGSVASFECRVNEIKSLGEHGGAGQLVFAEVLCVHVDDRICTGGRIDQEKIAHVARLGGDWYAHITPSNLFRVPKPHAQCGMGVDALPASVRTSDILTGNHLAQLASVPSLPEQQIDFTDERLEAMETYLKNGNKVKRIHGYVSELIEQQDIDRAWQVLLRM